MVVDETHVRDAVQVFSDFKGVNFMSFLPGDSSELCLLY
jgi:hypothetical protein